MILLEQVKQFRASLPSKEVYDDGHYFDRFNYVHYSINHASSNIKPYIKFQLLDLFYKCRDIKCSSYTGKDRWGFIDYSLLMEIIDLMEKFAKNSVFL